MFESIIAFSLRRRALVLLATVALIVGGLMAFTRLPVDAIPDITNNQVQVLTSAPALSPLEVEQQITFPVELALKSLPDLVELRSVSKSGLSVVTVVFDDDVEIYFARQLVLEKLREAEEDLPEGSGRPELAPVSTGLGEVYRYIVRDTTGKLDAMDLRTIQDWIVRRQLLGVPGLAEVNSLGGYVRQIHVLVDPSRLPAYGLTLDEIYEATAAASGTAGAAYIETGPEQMSVRSVGLVTTLDDLANTVVRATASGTPILLKDVAEVRVGSAIRFGAASQDGTGEVVTGITMALKDANARVTVNAVKERVEEIQEMLPDGVVIEPYYDREALVNRTLGTVARNLGEGALLVIVVLLLFLAHLRAGLILASVIPLAMLFAVILMVLTGQSGNLMSLGAVDFGLVVDGSLIIVENILRLLSGRMKRANGEPLTDSGLRNLVYSGATEMIRSAKYGVFIIILVYLPILTLEGIEGKMFRPMALTVSFALIGALVLSVTYVPVMCSLFLKGNQEIRESPVIAVLRRHYRPLLDRALGARKTIVGATVALFLVAVFGFTRLGGEFLPRLDEGDIAIHIIRLPSVSLSESQKITSAVERRLKAFPEVKTVVSSTGRAEISTDPMGYEVTDSFVILKPREEWPGRRSKAELIEAMSEAVADVPGAGVQFLQPIEMRTNELIAGVRGDVAVKLFGEDFDVLRPAAEKVAGILKQTPGAADVAVEQTSGQPYLIVRPNRDAIARYGLTVEQVNQTVATAIGGRIAGQVYEGERRVDMVVRYSESERIGPESVRAMFVATPTGQRVPLREIADISVEDGPAQVSREDGSRFVTVQANVRGRDVGSFVKELQRQVRDEVSMPAGYRIDYGGQFENLQDASRRLMVVVPMALGLIFLLLYQTFRSVRLGLLIFLCVPMSVIGAVAALHAARMPFSISAGVGFIALFGIAVLNGIVMVAAFRKFEHEGMTTQDAVRAGAAERLRPVVTTALLAALGFLPMLLARSAGAEVQRPLATVIIGGLFTATLLTLFVLPILYTWFAGDRQNILLNTTDSEPWMPDIKPHRSRPVVLPAVILFALAFALPARAQTTLTLKQMREEALRNSPDIRHAASDAVRARAERAGAVVLPGTEFFYTVDNTPTGSLPNDQEFAIGIAQNVQLPSYYTARRRVADAVVRQTDAEGEGIRRDVLRRASLAWIELAVAEQALALADSTVTLARQYVTATERRSELGEASGLEPLQAVIALADAERQRTEAKGRHAAALAGVTTMLVLPPGHRPTTSGLPDLQPMLDLSVLETRLHAANPNIVAALRTIDVARAEASVAASDKLPGIGLEVKHQKLGGQSGFFGGGVHLEVPLARWLNNGPDRLARAGIVHAEILHDMAVRQTLEELRIQYAGLAEAQEQVRAIRETLLPLSDRAYRIALQLREAGEAGYMEVLSAQSGLNQTHEAHAEALATAWRIRTEIEALVGQLTP